ncbi:hypothetical protein JCM10207_004676 [Rhodosporidiobolus poonsookiae]
MLALHLLVALAASAAAAPASSAATSSYTPSANLTAHGFTSQKWIKAFEKAQGIVKSMTLEEKINATSVNTNTRGCSGRTYAIEKYGVASQCMGDGPMGPNSRYSTQFPSEVTTAATWDADLFAARAAAMGKEYAEIGVHIPLSIVAGPLGRDVYGGRAWENFSPDPYLTGVATRLTVEGFQEAGVTGLIKHFFGNEQEYLRIGNPNGGYTGAEQNQTVSVTIDEATVHEAYVWPFVEGIRSGAGAIMTSYNGLNGTVTSENEAVLKTLLKEMLNFHGFLLSDWGAAFITVPAATAGMDFIEPRELFGAKAAELIANGTLPADILDDKVLRLIVPYFALDQPSLPNADFNRFVASQEHAKVVRDVAEGSITLLKNIRSDNETRGLPFDKPREIALVGTGAGPGPFGIVSDVTSTQRYTNATDFPGFVTGGFGSGGSPTSYVVTPLEGIQTRARKLSPPAVVDGYYSDYPSDGFRTIPFVGNDSFLDNKLNYAAAGEAVVFVSAVAWEGYDRVNLSLANGGDELVKYVADRHNSTTVVVTSPGPIDLSAWYDHPNVTSVLMSYFPTVEGGNAIASVLFGDVSPSGKLPFTLLNSTADYVDDRYLGPVIENPSVNFTEGVFLDYKMHDAKNVTPMFEFGYGGSYTTFSFSDLKVSQTTKANKALVRETNEKFFPTGKLSSGLYDTAFTVKATVKNTGSVTGAEVAQLYLSFPDSTPRQMPVRSLRGFSKPSLKAGESKTVSFELRNKDLAYYDVVLGGWRVPAGEFTVSVGSSSRKLPLTGKMTV